MPDVGGGQAGGGQGGGSTASGGGAGGQGQNIDGGLVLGPDGCQPVSLDAGVSVGTYTADQYRYFDSRCQPRTAALARLSTTSVGGDHGGFLRRYTYTHQGQVRTCNGNDGADAYHGFGYVVNHCQGCGVAGDYSSSWEHAGATQLVLKGRHHAIHEFKWALQLGGPFTATVHWLFATGRSHPIYAITYDVSGSAVNVVRGDSRSPYGDIKWDATGGPVEGIAWGEQYRFTTTGSGPVTWATAWDYTQPNSVPFAMQWSTTADAEMGIVQTEPFAKHVAGGDYGNGQLAQNCWAKTSQNKGAQCAEPGKSLPIFWLWPYQLNQYELDSTTASHRLAWGTNMGAIGQSTVSAFGRMFSGYPYLSYSTFVVFGGRQERAVDAELAQIEAAAGTEVVGLLGTPASQAPGGAGRTDLVALSPSGYNPVYATFDVQAVGNAARLRFDTKGKTLDAPMLRLLGYSAAAAPTHVVAGGRELVADRDYFATFDAAHQTLWLTLNGTLRGMLELAIE